MKLFCHHSPQLFIRIAVFAAATLALGGCNFAPRYHTPSTPGPTAYKEVTPENEKDIANWKTGQPSDAAVRGNWWEMFNDAQLNQLEQQATKSNQSIAAASASFFAARALVKEARSQLFPTVSVGPSISRSHQSANLKGGGVAGATGSGAVISSSAGDLTDYALPFDATWVPDLWGRVRNTIAANAFAAQSSAADLANTRLSIQSEVATDYFELRSEDALKQLLDATVEAYRQSLDLTKAQYETGIASDESVAQAETQLETTEAQDTNVGILRAEYEHAIAMLVGQPASTFSIPQKPLDTPPPPIPFGVPSELLERRPDIAASERLVAEANAQIGVARAAYYPTVTLSASAGLESTALADWFTWPSRFWSVGPSLSETIFDAGLRRATVEQYRAQYDETVANYRQTVLAAFQNVEDNLSSLRVLSHEIDQQNVAIQSSQRYLDLANDRYKLGIDPYLNVITAQTTLLSNKQTLVNLQTQQMTASVGLIEAVGGGWSRGQMPSAAAIRTATP